MRLSSLLLLLVAASCSGAESSEGEPGVPPAEDAQPSGGHAGSGGKGGTGGATGKGGAGGTPAGGAGGTVVEDAGSEHQDSGPDVDEDEGGADVGSDADATADAEGGANPCSGACVAALLNACTCGASDPCGWANDGNCQQGCHDGAWGLDDAADCDRDKDGMPDSVELALATSFAPSLIFSSNEYYRGRLTFWAAEPSQNNLQVSIFYALGYFEDAGDPETGLFKHKGDSEFVVVEATTPDGVTWTPVRVFMSAHYESLSDSSDWYDAADVQFETSDGLAHPLTWVAVWKHANYPTIEACDKGAFFTDKCDNGSIERAEIRPDANLGSAQVPLIDEVIDVEAGTSYYEYYWSDLAFCGWQVASKDADDRSDCTPEANSYSLQLADWLTGKL